MNFHLQIPFLLAIILSFLLKELLEEQNEDFTTIKMYLKNFYKEKNEKPPTYNTLINSIKKRYSENINSLPIEENIEPNKCRTFDRYIKTINNSKEVKFLEKEQLNVIFSKISQNFIFKFKKNDPYIRVLSLNNNYLGYNKSLTGKILIYFY